MTLTLNWNWNWNNFFYSESYALNAQQCQCHIHKPTFNVMNHFFYRHCNKIVHIFASTLFSISKFNPFVFEMHAPKIRDENLISLWNWNERIQNKKNIHCNSNCILLMIYSGFQWHFFACTEKIKLSRSNYKLVNIFPVFCYCMNRFHLRNIHHFVKLWTRIH